MFGFDPISWAIGYGSKKVADKILTKIYGPELNRLLRSEAKKWSQHLPDNSRIDPEVFFSVTYTGDFDSKKFPARSTLQENLASMLIPSQEIWLQAFKEHREDRRRTLKDQAHSFFLLNDDETNLHLEDLAEKFHRACSQVSVLFQVTTMDNIDKQLELTRNMMNQIQDLRLFLGDQEASGKGLTTQIDPNFTNTLFVINISESRKSIGCAIDNNGTVIFVTIGESEVTSIAPLSNIEISPEFTVLYKGSWLSLLKVEWDTKGVIFAKEYEIDKTGKIVSSIDLKYFDQEGNTYKAELIGLYGSTMISLHDGKKAYFADQYLAKNVSDESASISGPYFNLNDEVVGMSYAGAPHTTLIKPLTNAFQAFFYERFDIKPVQAGEIPVNI